MKVLLLTIHDAHRLTHSRITGYCLLVNLRAEWLTAGRKSNFCVHRRGNSPLSPPTSSERANEKPCDSQQAFNTAWGSSARVCWDIGSWLWGQCGDTPRREKEHDSSLGLRKSHKTRGKTELQTCSGADPGKDRVAKRWREDFKGLQK